MERLRLKYQDAFNALKSLGINLSDEVLLIDIGSHEEDDGLEIRDMYRFSEIGNASHDFI